MLFSNFKINYILIQDKEYNTYFQKIEIDSNKEIKTLLIDNIHIWELVLENINNNFESFEIRNCIINKLVIRNSNLWKAVFNWVTIKKLEIQNATLNDCIFNWVDFKKYELLNESKVSPKIMKDNYRQLKHVMDKNANYTEANIFFGLEIYYYYKSLKWYNFNKIILLIQWLISYFWNSWILAIIWIIVYWLLITNWSWDVYFYDYISLLNHNNINFYNSFFTNINPFNKSLFTSSNITLWLFFNKMVLIILYYQLIIALKRTTKR